MFRAALDGTVQGWYDSNFVATGPVHLLSAIAPPGSDAARQSRFFDLVDGGASLKLDIQTPVGEAAQAQGFLDAQVVGDDLVVRQGFIRVANVLAGQYWTAWGDEGALPRSIMIDTNAAGAVYAPNVPQIRVALPRENWVSTFAIQQPLNGDFTLVDRTAPGGDVRLQRYPDFAARLRYFDQDYNSFSIGALVRGIGREDIAQNEDFVVGWGLSAATRFRLTPCSAVQLGFFGGEGIAGSILGLLGTQSAAGPTNTLLGGGQLSALSNYGGYAGFERRWSQTCESNFAYGFVQAEGSDFMPAGSARTGQNAWANVIRKINDNFAVGLEYHYGRFETLDGSSSDNHRVHFVFQLSTSPPETDGSAADRIITSLGSQADSLMQDSIRASVPRSSGGSRFPRL